MTNGFARRKEQSKEDIRTAAWELFSHFGIEKVSIVDISHKAGVSQATIYNNFGSKDALAREFVAAAIDQLVIRVQQILTPDKLFWEKMKAVLQFISENTAHQSPTGVDGAAFSTHYDLLNDPDLKKIRDSAQEKMSNILLELVQEGKQQGQIAPELSEEACRIYFRAFMDIFTDPRLQFGFTKDPMLVQNLGRLMIYGLSGQRES